MLTYVFGLSRGGRGSPRDAEHMRQHRKFKNSDAPNRNFPKVFELFFIFQELAPEIPFSVENQFLHQFLRLEVPREALAKPQKPRRAKLENRKNDTMNT